MPLGSQTAATSQSLQADPLVRDQTTVRRGGPVKFSGQPRELIRGTPGCAEAGSEDPASTPDTNSPHRRAVPSPSVRTLWLHGLPHRLKEPPRGLHHSTDSTHLGTRPRVLPDRTHCQDIRHVALQPLPQPVAQQGRRALRPQYDARTSRTVPEEFV